MLDAMIQMSDLWRGVRRTIRGHPISLESPRAKGFIITNHVSITPLPLKRRRTFDIELTAEIWSAGFLLFSTE
ncbi:hypothetical protein DTW90_01940 [Neorhizobium sp. P12A]|jgi:hypothetical protein|nr:hypothetical protein DTW90_01940 [Neorhizobium sp. P12A]